MVVAMGEFGRTPKINPAGGRDHWPQCWTMLMGGGPLKGGKVVGASDEIGAAPKDRPVTPAQDRRDHLQGLGIDLQVGTAGRAGPADSAGRPRRGADRGAVCMKLAAIFLLVPVAPACAAPDCSPFCPPSRRTDRARSPPAIDRRGHRRRPSGGLDARRAVDFFGSQDRHSRQTGMVTPVADGAATITADAQGQYRDRRGAREGRASPVHLELPQPRHPGADQDGLQLGRLPRRAGRQERLQADAARLRSGRRLRHADAAVGRPARVARRARRQPDAAEADVRDPARRRQALRADSLEYRVIAEWIAAGTPPPAASDPQITGLEVYPASAMLKPGAEQQIVVRAKYSDGQSRDVTRWVKFSSSDEGVAPWTIPATSR